jgi:hypothetical protein
MPCQFPQFTAGMGGDSLWRTCKLWRFAGFSLPEPRLHTYDACAIGKDVAADKVWDVTVRMFGVLGAEHAGTGKKFSRAWRQAAGDAGGNAHCGSPDA